MSKNTIHLELDQLNKLDSVIERLDAILTAMQTLGPLVSASSELGQKALEHIEPDIKESDRERETPTEPARVVKLSDIQQKVVELSAAGMKAQARDIVKAYAEKVSAIPEDKLQEVWDKLDSLEA